MSHYPVHKKPVDPQAEKNKAILGVIGPQPDNAEQAWYFRINRILREFSNGVRHAEWWVKGTPTGETDRPAGFTEPAGERAKQPPADETKPVDKKPADKKPPKDMTTSWLRFFRDRM
jgi:hypothetical protein